MDSSCQLVSIIFMEANRCREHTKSKGEVQALNLDYDQLAAEYARHRAVHPVVLRELARGIDDSSRVLEVGCGTGNYILALTGAAGCEGWGVDPSRGMLKRASVRTGSVRFSLGRGEDLGLPPDFFDLVFSVDVIHHVTDRDEYFAEAHRVLRRRGRLCTVTDSVDIIKRRVPLSQYFPETVERELQRYPAMAELRRMMKEAGFTDVSERTVEFHYQLQDLGPYRDRAFSSLHLIPDDAFERGLDRMQRDLEGAPYPA